MAGPSPAARVDAPAILTQATLRAAELLGISQKYLARILGALSVPGAPLSSRP